MKFENTNNLIECFNEITKNNILFEFCLKNYEDACSHGSCVNCKFFININTLSTRSQKEKFVIDILRKNITYPRGCGSCLTYPCMHQCTGYLIKKYKIKL